MLESITINRQSLRVTGHVILGDKHLYATTGLIEHHYLEPNRYVWTDDGAVSITTSSLEEMARSMGDAYHVPVEIE